MWIVKKHKDFWNIDTRNIKELARKESELIGVFWKENMDMLEVTEIKRKIRGNGNRRSSFFDL